MRAFTRFIMICALAVTGCTDVRFMHPDHYPGSEKLCTGSDCAEAYSWFASGFGSCSKPCGTGTQTQDVSCRRHSDQVAVDDALCPDARPESQRACHVHLCSTTHAWVAGSFGPCSRTCGGGWRERQVVCRHQSGAAAADSFCAAERKPSATEFCNANPCPKEWTYSWLVTPGLCSKPCGEGRAVDRVECRRSDGAKVADELCAPKRKPPSTQLCNIHPCSAQASHKWSTGRWSACSAACGEGLQTRPVVCLRSDGKFAPESRCDQNQRPSAEQTCRLKNCPPGRRVEQSLSTPAAASMADLIVIADDSAHMAKDLEKLAGRLGQLLSDLENQKIDYQLCLTTTDFRHGQGRPVTWLGRNSHILTSSTPNKDKVILDTIKSLGDGWSSDEQAIRVASALLRGQSPTPCARPGSTLAFIVISDEDERSVGGQKSWSLTQHKPLTPENDPENLIRQVGEGPMLWNSIIVKPFDHACQARQDAEGSPSFYGRHYARLSNLTGGVIASICDEDYESALRQVRDRILAAQPGLALECTPIDSPTIRIEGTGRPAAHLSADELKFEPRLTAGTRVNLVYTCPH